MRSVSQPNNRYFLATSPQENKPLHRVLSESVSQSRALKLTQADLGMENSQPPEGCNAEIPSSSFYKQENSSFHSRGPVTILTWLGTREWLFWTQGCHTSIAGGTIEPSISDMPKERICKYKLYLDIKCGRCPAIQPAWADAAFTHPEPASRKSEGWAAAQKAAGAAQETPWHLIPPYIVDLWVQTSECNFTQQAPVVHECNENLHISTGVLWVPPGFAISHNANCWCLNQYQSAFNGKDTALQTWKDHTLSDLPLVQATQALGCRLITLKRYTVMFHTLQLGCTRRKPASGTWSLAVSLPEQNSIRLTLGWGTATALSHVLLSHDKGHVVWFTVLPPTGHRPHSSVSSCTSCSKDESTWSSFDKW